MANNDLRESFPTTEDSSTGAGVPLTKTLEGDAAAGKVGSVGFAFKDSSGNVILPQLDSQGRVPVSTEVVGTRTRTHNAVAGGLLGSSPYTFNTVLALTLTAAKTYVDLNGKVACRRGGLFQLVYKDASNSVILDEAIVEAGQYTTPIGILNDTFTVPASASTPQFLILGGTYDKVSDLHATVGVTQLLP